MLAYTGRGKLVTEPIDMIQLIEAAVASGDPYEALDEALPERAVKQIASLPGVDNATVVKV
jgi:hypothetical protein